MSNALVGKTITRAYIEETELRLEFADGSAFHFDVRVADDGDGRVDVWQDGAGYLPPRNDSTSTNHQ